MLQQKKLRHRLMSGVTFHYHLENFETFYLIKNLQVALVLFLGHHLSYNNKYF